MSNNSTEQPQNLQANYEETRTPIEIQNILANEMLEFAIKFQVQPDRGEFNSLVNIFNKLVATYNIEFNPNILEDYDVEYPNLDTALLDLQKKVTEYRNDVTSRTFFDLYDIHQILVFITAHKSFFRSKERKLGQKRRSLIHMTGYIQNTEEFDALAREIIDKMTEFKASPTEQTLNEILELIKAIWKNERIPIPYPIKYGIPQNLLIRNLSFLAFRLNRDKKLNDLFKLYSVVQELIENLQDQKS